MIKNSLSDKNIDQLIGYTNADNEVKRNTSDMKRFKDRNSFDEWRKKGRSIYALVDENDNLLGISWFGEKIEGFTLSVRIYGSARGKGLSKSFLEETMVDFMKKPEYLNAKDKNWWLEVSKDNIPAIKIYEKLGFVFLRDGTTTDKAIYCRVGK